MGRSFINDRVQQMDEKPEWQPRAGQRRKERQKMDWRNGITLVHEDNSLIKSGKGTGTNEKHWKRATHRSG